MSIRFHHFRINLQILFIICLLGNDLYAQEILELDPVESLADASDGEQSGSQEIFSNRLEHAEHVVFRSGSLETSDLLGELSSVRVSDNGSRLQQHTFAYRGAAAQDIVIRYFGVPLNALSDASADLTLIPAQLIDSADIFTNGLYESSGSVGGLVDLNSKPAETPISASISASSIKDFSLFGRGKMRFENGSIDASVFGDYSKGSFPYIDVQNSLQFREHNAASRFGTQISGYYHSDIARLSAFSLFSSIHRQEAGLSEYPARYRFATQDSWLSLTGIQTEFAPFMAGHALTLFSLNASHRAANHTYDNPTAFIGGSKTHSNYLENRTQIRADASFTAPKYSQTMIEIGADFQHLSSDFLVSGITTSKSYSRYLLNLSASELLSFFEDTLQLSAGLHLDWNVEEKPLFSPHAAIRYSPLPSLSIWFSSAMGERYPAFDENYFHTEYMRGNADLKPQQSILNELGISWHPAKWLKVSASGFYNIHKQLIRFMPVSINLYEAQNIPQSFAKGFEISLYSTFWKGMTIGGNYTLTDAKTDDNMPLPTTAKHRVHGSLTWDDNIWHAGFHILYTTKIPRNLLGTNYTPQKLRLNLEASLRIYDKWHLSMSIQNLLNDMSSEDVLQHPLPGRHAFITLEYR